MPDWFLYPLLGALVGGLAVYLLIPGAFRRAAPKEPAPPFQRTHDHERLIASLRSWLSDEKVVRVILDSRVMLGPEVMMTRDFVDVLLEALDRFPESAAWDVARCLLAPRSIRVALLAHEQRPGFEGWPISDLLQSERLYERRTA